ncbi:MAG: efflux RND transporter periplasmic adaptor subunit [Candidatus Eisenbacteria bacterium]
MSRWTRRLLILGGIVLVVLILRWTVFRPEPVPVTVATVERGRVESTVVNTRAGTVESRRRSQMSPGVSGLVAAIPVRKGQRVRAGDVLLRIDDTEYRAQFAQADRSRAAARAAAEQACASADQARRDGERAEQLATQGLIADQRLEEARTNAEVATAGCEAAREQTRQAQASVEAAQAALDKTVIRAPFDGVVLDVTTEVGEWITPSPPGVMIPPVVDLIDPDSLYVSAPLDEADVAKVHLGLPVRITMDAFRGQEFPGVLTYISSFVETRQEQNRTLTVEATFTQQDLPRNLVPGLSADVEVILEAQEDVVRIPTYALLEGDRVLVVEKGRLVSRPVRIGLRNWEYAEITGGLREGEEVVVSLDRPEVKAGVRATVAERTARR